MSIVPPGKKTYDLISAVVCWISPRGQCLGTSLQTAPKTPMRLVVHVMMVWELFDSCPETKSSTPFAPIICACAYTIHPLLQYAGTTG